MRRRQFLASGTALLSVAVAGCGHPPVVLDLDEAADEDVASEVSTTVSADSSSDAEEYAVLSEAVENGTARRTGRHELFDRTDAARFEGVFYEVNETRLERDEVDFYEVIVESDPDDATAELGEVAFEDLPETDRKRLEGYLEQAGPPEGNGYGDSVDYGTAEAVGNDSVFVPERQYDVLVYEGERYPVAVNVETVLEAEYRYEVTELAPDAETFADRIREQYLFTLSGLSEAEREVVAEAIDGGYFEDDDAFQSVVDRIREHDGLNVDDSWGTWLLEYEGTEYTAYVEW